MSEIQRWSVTIERHTEKPHLRHNAVSYGEYVRYEDHLAALRACEQRVRGEALAEFVGYFSERDYAAGVQAARDAVALIHRHYENGLTGGSCSVCGGRWPCETVAAIDALKGEQS